MKKFLFLFMIICFMLISCKKNEDAPLTPVRDFAVQDATDTKDIIKFLQTHSIAVTNHPGLSDDQDVIFNTTAINSPLSIWGTNDLTPNNPNLKTITVSANGITYTMYYLQLRQGSGTSSVSPCNLDNVLVSYKGYLLNNTETVFDYNPFPSSYLSLSGVIKAWNELLPQFKTGSSVGNPDGTVSYNDFGAGIMFVPSGLGYFNQSVGTTNNSSYAPLIFTFKLYKVERVDNDGDGIFSYQEDVFPVGNPDGYIRTADDTDADGRPDAFDIDDDGDGYTTKSETKYLDSQNVVHYYPYNGAIVDDLSTIINETLGIPSCSGDKINPTRVRKHLDASCH
jgi:hypothetical protein